MPSVPVRQSNLVGLCLRISWMGLGPIFLFVMGAIITQRHGYSMVDALYAIVVVGTFTARVVDIVKYQGTRADGEPATVSTYALQLFVIAGAGWGGAHGLQSII